MLKVVLATFALVAVAVQSQAQEFTKPPKGPAPRFVTVQSFNAETMELTLTEECLPHPAVVSRSIVEPEPNRRPFDFSKGISCSLVMEIHYYTTTHKLSVHHLQLQEISGKKFEKPAETLAGLKPGTMVLMSADGYPIEPEYLPLLRPETLVLVVNPNTMPSVYESPESTSGMTKVLKAE